MAERGARYEHLGWLDRKPSGPPHQCRKYVPICRARDGSNFRDRDVEARLDHCWLARIRRRRPSWTWKQLTDESLKQKQLKLRVSYRKAYERYLRLDEFGPINNKMVRDIELRDLEKVRNQNRARRRSGRTCSSALEFVPGARTIAGQR
ncbi:hypothetical protein BJS_08865 [Bradyrhizobium japonicum SEMIA 5079]|nr:hypothetical protein BJS_08865 [Bradyrhizobium japonicum SEMIA 5079]